MSSPLNVVNVALESVSIADVCVLPDSGGAIVSTDGKGMYNARLLVDSYSELGV